MPLYYLPEDWNLDRELVKSLAAEVQLLQERNKLYEKGRMDLLVQLHQHESGMASPDSHGERTSGNSSSSMNASHPSSSESSLQRPSLSNDVFLAGSGTKAKKANGEPEKVITRPQTESLNYHSNDAELSYGVVPSHDSQADPKLFPESVQVFDTELGLGSRQAVSYSSEKEISPRIHTNIATYSHHGHQTSTFHRDAESPTVQRSMGNPPTGNIKITQPQDEGSDLGVFAKRERTRSLTVSSPRSQNSVLTFSPSLQADFTFRAPSFARVNERAASVSSPSPRKTGVNIKDEKVVPHSPPNTSKVLDLKDQTTHLPSCSSAQKTIADEQPRATYVPSTLDQALAAMTFQQHPVVPAITNGTELVKDQTELKYNKGFAGGTKQDYFLDRSSGVLTPGKSRIGDRDLNAFCAEASPSPSPSQQPHVDTLGTPRDVDEVQSNSWSLVKHESENATWHEETKHDWVWTDFPMLNDELFRLLKEALEDLAKKPLNVTEKRKCEIYVFKTVDDRGNDYVKVGITINFRGRMLEQKRCYGEIKQVYRAEVPHGRRVENLVQVALRDCRKRVECPRAKHRVKHGEWFNTSEENVIAVIERWIAFAESDFYSELDVLLRTFDSNVDNLLRSVLSGLGDLDMLKTASDIGGALALLREVPGLD